MTDEGLYFHVTRKGAILMVARSADESVTFQPTLEQAKNMRDELNRTIAQLESQEQ